MKLSATALAGVWLVELEPIVDERGFFARSFCRRELAGHGVTMQIAQTNLSFNARRGTLRGLHYQAEPHGEIKVVSCIAGAIFDVVVELASGRWIGVELDAERRQALVIPTGFAHGFQTLVDGATVSYLMSTEYVASAARGVRWDSLGIAWPIATPILSPRDAAFPGL